MGTTYHVPQWIGGLAAVPQLSVVAGVASTISGGSNGRARYAYRKVHPRRELSQCPTSARP
jgi:hypothetical protein